MPASNGSSRPRPGSTCSWQQDIFDDTWQWADAHLSIFGRTLMLSVGTTVLTLAPGLSHRLVHRHPAQAQPQLLAVPGHHAVLVQPAGAHLRHHAADPQRGRDQQHPARAGPDRAADPDALHRLRRRHRHGLCLPAADGAAALCQHREARLPPGRGRLRPLRQPLAGADPGDPAAGPARPGRGLDPGLHPRTRCLCRPAHPGRRQPDDDRQPHRPAVRPGPQLAARCGRWRCS